MALETVAIYGGGFVAFCVTVLLSAKMYFKHVLDVKRTEAEVIEDGKNYRAEIRDNRERAAMNFEAQMFNAENNQGSDEDDLFAAILPLLAGGGGSGFEGIIKNLKENPAALQGLLQNPEVQALINSGGESGGSPAK